MKRFISVFAVVCLLCGLFSMTASAATQYAMCSTPTLDGTVYVRTVAGAGQPVAGIARNGDTLVVLQKGNTWHKVRVVRTGIEGWIYGKYVVFIGYSQESSSSSWSSWETSTTEDTTGKYTADASVLDTDTMINKFGTVSSSDGYANLRWGPGTSFKVISKIYNSTQVCVLEQNGSWYRCDIGNGYIGYISKNLVKLTDTTIYATTGLSGVIRSSDGYASVRSGAGTGYSQLYTLNVGNTITAYASSGEWLRISSSTSWTPAYVHRNLVRFRSAAVTTGNVNLRTGPTKDYEIIRALPTGAKVTLLATDGNFCRVDTGKEIAYLSCKYLTF